MTRAGSALEAQLSARVHEQVRYVGGGVLQAQRDRRLYPECGLLKGGRQGRSSYSHCRVKMTMTDEFMTYIPLCPHPHCWDVDMARLAHARV